MKYTKQEKIIELLKTTSNQVFTENEDHLKECIYDACLNFDDIDEDEDFPQENILPEIVVEFIIRDCINGLHDTIRWYTETPDYWDNIK